MISFEIFDERLNVVKDSFKKIRTEFSGLAEGLSHIIEDYRGVPHTWVCDLAEAQFYNLCLAVNKNLSKLVLKMLSSYYIWENDFKGKVEQEGKTLDLSISEQLYEYIKTL